MYKIQKERLIFEKSVLATPINAEIEKKYDDAIEASGKSMDKYKTEKDEIKI